MLEEVYSFKEGSKAELSKIVTIVTFKVLDMIAWIHEMDSAKENQRKTIAAKIGLMKQSE